MCGPTSAIGLQDAERTSWPALRERLREPGQLMGLMRGVLGGETDVAVVVATSSDGLSVPRAILVTPAIADELAMSPGGPSRGVQIGKVGEYAVEVVVDEASGAPLALLMSPWIFENLSLYARKLWWRRRDQSP